MQILFCVTEHVQFGLKRSMPYLGLFIFSVFNKKMVEKFLLISTVSSLWCVVHRSSLPPEDYLNAGQDAGMES